MTQARRYTVNPGLEGVYHCIARCVRRGFLCGFDALTGKNYDHRKEWVRTRLKELQSIFTIDVLAYAIMCTHNHTMLRNRPDLMEKLSDEEVAIRWLRLFPHAQDGDGPYVNAVQAIVSNSARVKILRERLCNISWFMRCLDEHIARKANKEDEVTGRFWEGRFKCIRLDNEAAILACMVYVDLNEIRAKRATTPEESRFTSAHERITARKVEKEIWLSPIENTGERRGTLSLTLDEYLTVLDLTGREAVREKSGKIPEVLAPILDRLKVSSGRWLDATSSFEKFFSRVVGDAECMRSKAKEIGQKWFKGITAAQKIFG
jgi:hypothetical protein